MLSDNALHTQSPMPADPSHRAADCMIADLMRQMEEDARRQTAAIEELERLHAASASALWHEERVACDGSALERDCVPLGAHSWDSAALSAHAEQQWQQWHPQLADQQPSQSTSMTDELTSLRCAFRKRLRNGASSAMRFTCSRTSLEGEIERSVRSCGAV